MSTHTAVIQWERKNAAFTGNKYSRAHLWTFDGGAIVPASSSPHVVRVPLSDPSCVDPEEAYVAALASCHMLWFLDIAARAGHVVESYTDHAEGLLDKDTKGKPAITRVTLRPHVIFSSNKNLSESEVTHLHHQAHESCFLANSVKSEILIESTWEQLN